ncbi:Holliday junction resolvase RecU [Mycoplasma sp. 744]|uniref:Holliday junction resolvase RecU n=1 Tax=Mycoplasma sp. 744 TaxID=3108531 RepID=UPI002B1D0365|nr:Holliday junction resolvase RecU [Mycoplasma sp. 744]MEA4115308.1 Holliday junction resolvase RecU [Mycoplasma sp. 744]
MKNRGMLLETILNNTINYYFKNKLAIIEKKTLPIKFNSINKNKDIIGGHLFAKSTVDYTGCYNGLFVAFEAKSTNKLYLPKTNIKKHQIQYLDIINANGGKSFFIIFFSKIEEFYFIEFKQIKEYLDKSIHYKIIKKQGKKLDLIYPGIIDFLPCLLENN